MNIKTAIGILALAITLTFGGCGSDSGTASADGGNAMTGTGGTPGTAGGAGGAGPSCDTSYKCNAAISPGGDPSRLCPGTVAASAFEVVNTCVCAGACAAKCADSVCAQTAPNVACLGCLMDTSVGCGKEAMACASN